MSNLIDEQTTLLKHRERIQKNKFLHQLYTDFYRRMVSVPHPPGIIVELGSGAGFLKEILPSVITSDVVEGTEIDKVFSATAMPFADKSVAAFLLYDVFHHIKDPEMALREMARTLKSGGKIVMIEPYNSVWGRFVYQHFHHESFDPSAQSWIINGEGRLSDANGAMPWIIFVRDRNLFEKKFSNLKIVEVMPHTPLAYLCSGGLSKPQLLPGFCYPLVKAGERLLWPFRSWIGMFVTVVLERD